MEDGPYKMPMVKEKFKLGGEITYYDSIDADKCKGNFMALKNGNIMLDLYQYGGMFSLGYNNDLHVEHANLNTFKRALLEPILDEESQKDFQSREYFEMLDKTLVAMSPAGMTCVQTLKSNKSPLIEAVKIAVSRFKDNRKDKWDTSYKGFHEDEKISGKCFSVLSLQSSECDLMNYHYPVEIIPLPTNSKKSSSSQEESQCLEVCYQTIKNAILSMKHPAAMVVDPIRLGKDILSNQFYQTLQVICNEFDIAFIVNEMDTCLGVTGEIWAHSHWGLLQPPDMVVFGKRMTNSGFYTQTGFLQPEVLKGINGSREISRLMLLDVTLKYICDQNLFTRVTRVSEMLKNNMDRIQEKFAEIIENISCNGLMCSIDFYDDVTKHKADIILLNKGLHFGRVTDKSLTMMPALILNENHVTYLNDCLHSTLQELSERNNVKNNDGGVLKIDTLVP